MSKNRAIATNPRDAVSKYVRACQIAYDIKDIVEYRDGVASFPAYLLEQLWDELAVVEGIQRIANARLIAAAPELLEALRRCATETRFRLEVGRND